VVVVVGVAPPVKTREERVKKKSSWGRRVADRGLDFLLERRGRD